MKDKAEVLVEVDKLQRVRDELSTEVSSLAAQLEQEKSKVRSLTTGDAKGKDKVSSFSLLVYNWFERVVKSTDFRL